MNNNDIKKLYADFLANIHPFNVAITIQYNDGLLNEVEAKRRLKRLFGYAYRQLFGGRWYKMKDKQFPWIGFIEKGSSKSNTHCHLAIEIPEELTEQFELLLHLKAYKINSKMKVYTKPMTTVGWLRYLVKEVDKDNNSFIYFKDFY